jgi:dolichol-phosphate mannosyltransferase
LSFESLGSKKQVGNLVPKNSNTGDRRMQKTMRLPEYRINIIVPVYNEASNIIALYENIKDVFVRLPAYNWKILFVDDASVDNSWAIISELSESDKRICGICLSRNFGKEKALTAGVEAMNSVDAAITMDADMQHPPEIIPDLIREWRDGAEIVVGIRKQCADYSIVKKLGSKLFYMIMRRFSDLDIPPNSTDFRLLDRKVLDTLYRFSERTRMFRGLIDWLGFKKTFLEFSAPKRHNDSSPSYSYKKLFQLAINSFTSFSLLPLRITAYLGILVSTFSGLLLSYMVATDFFDLQVYTPQAYLVVFNTLLAGVMLSAIGMTALYIGHIHTEVVGRPLYIVREKTGWRDIYDSETSLLPEEKDTIIRSASENR